MAGRHLSGHHSLRLTLCVIMILVTRFYRYHPHVNFGDKAETIRLVEAANDDGKSLAQQYPIIRILGGHQLSELDAVKTVQQALTRMVL